jgi:hypothetical protein
MALIRYRELKLNAASLWQIQNVNKVIDYFKSLGYEMTLRQVFYQLVKANIIKNEDNNYKNLGNLISKGRLAGLIDWDAIIDRTRFVRKRSHFSSVQEFMTDLNYSYSRDLRVDQDEYIEVWVEKDALIDIIARVANKNDVPHFSCRGNTSQTEMFNASQRLVEMSQGGTRPVTIIHLGDHDPSGIDMTRDIEDRLTEFGAGDYGIVVNRIALNMDQVQQYQPPKNPAKETDSRFKKYKERFGTDSWELDALDPQVLEALIQKHIDEHTDKDKYLAQRVIQEQHRQEIKKAESFAADSGAWIEKSNLVEIGSTGYNQQYDKAYLKLDDEDTFIGVDKPVFLISEEEADAIEASDSEFEE